MAHNDEFNVHRLYKSQHMLNKHTDGS